jgi:hypothetical protein
MFLSLQAYSTIMKDKIKNKLFEAWIYCDENDKSTEFMLQYMQDFAGVDLDCVVAFLEKTTTEQRDDWYKSKIVISNL